MSKEKICLSTIYHFIYESKFGNDSFILTKSGWIKNKPVYLEIGDLNISEHLQHILDMYEYIYIEEYLYNIIIAGNNQYTYCKHRLHIYNTYCADCNMYVCEKCCDNHMCHNLELCEKHTQIYNNCDKCQLITHLPLINCEHKTLCFNCNENFTNKTTTTPIINFNMYEWIPIMNFLENRNPNSNMYKRKIYMNFSEKNIIFNLIAKEINHTFVSHINTKLLISYKLLFDYYKIPLLMDSKLIKLINDVDNIRDDNTNITTKKHKTIILLN